MKEDFADPAELVIIGFDTDDGPEHPLYDERVLRDLDENLVRNVMVYGVQQSVLVREEAGRRIVIAGRRRVRAAREASRRADVAGEHAFKVPIRRVIDEDARIAGIMISENEIREGDDVLTKARKAGRLLNQLKDINEVAIAFGKSKTTIRNWLSLLEADPAVHEALRAELISAAAAVEIAIKPRSEQVDLLNQLLPATLGGGEPVSESRARKARQLSEGGHKPQAGVKRTWVRSALTTRQAHNLTDDQRYLLRWFATGAAPADSWISAFEQAVNEELAVKKARSSEPS